MTIPARARGVSPGSVMLSAVSLLPLAVAMTGTVDRVTHAPTAPRLATLAMSAAAALIASLLVGRWSCLPPENGTVVAAVGTKKPRKRTPHGSGLRDER